MQVSRRLPLLCSPWLSNYSAVGCTDRLAGSWTFNSLCFITYEKSTCSGFKSSLLAVCYCSCYITVYCADSREVPIWACSTWSALLISRNDTVVSFWVFHANRRRSVCHNWCSETRCGCQQRSAGQNAQLEKPGSMVLEYKGAVPFCQRLSLSGAETQRSHDGWDNERGKYGKRVVSNVSSSVLDAGDENVLYIYFSFHSSFSFMAPYCVTPPILLQRRRCRQGREQVSRTRVHHSHSLDASTIINIDSLPGWYFPTIPRSCGKKFQPWNCAVSHPLRRRHARRIAEVLRTGLGDVIASFFPNWTCVLHQTLHIFVSTVQQWLKKPNWVVFGLRLSEITW